MQSAINVLLQSAIGVESFLRPISPVGKPWTEKRTRGKRDIRWPCDRSDDESLKLTEWINESYVVTDWLQDVHQKPFYVNRFADSF